MNTQAQTTNTWHALNADSVLQSLGAQYQGLNEAEAAIRLSAVGPNALPSAPSPPWWLIGLRQFRSPLIYILVLAAVVSAAIGEFTDASFIAVVLLMNALIGGVQEWRAERSTRALQKLLRIIATVVRNGQANEIDAEQVVPGDVVWLESGNRVPADLRLLNAHGLEIDESLLTGESIAVAKNPGWIGPTDTPLADRINMAYAGSIVTHGRAKGVVTATGTSTHVGSLALDVMKTAGGKPPLLIRLERFTQVIGTVVLIAVVLIATIGILFYSQDASTMFLFSIALAVSAIPEGLPVAITVALAVATTRMARRGVIVRNLGAVEGLGSCTHIFSDKTGTLTCNEMTVQKLYLSHGQQYEVTGEGFAPIGQVTFNGTPIDRTEYPRLETLARTAVLCNEADLHHHDDRWVWRGDPTDIALLTLGAKLGFARETELDLYPQVNQIPFEPEHQFSASYHRIDGLVQVFVKGAPERIFKMCQDKTAAHTINAARLAAQRFAEDGCRVLALATGLVDEEQDLAQSPSIPSLLTPVGVVGMIDPLRPGVTQAIGACDDAGMTAYMVTGDHPTTASTIGYELGLARKGDRVINGSELEKALDSDIERFVSEAHIFARVTPHQKLRIVQASQRLGHFVAVTGDGANDAPALQQANIGVAMGRSGTDVAREAADIVISDDNFATIVAGVEEGRIAYNNIRNVIYLLISTGAAEVVLVTLSVAFGMPLPLLPVQLLWLNLVTNGIQDVALAFEPARGNELRRQPRPAREGIFNRLMIERTLAGALVMGTVAFGVFAWMINAGSSETSARNTVLLLMVLFENIHIGNCRSETESTLRLSPLRSPILLIGVITAFLVHVAAMHLPITQKILGIQPVSMPIWIFLFVAATSVFVAMEAHKWSWAKRHNQSLPNNP